MAGVKGKSGIYDNSKRKTMFKLGVKRSEEDKLKMRVPKKTTYSDLKIKAICKYCEKEYSKNSSTQLYCKVCAPAKKFTDLIRHYNLSYPQYLKMLEVCSGICEICLNEKATAIDHNHKTNKVRGILCHGCNVALGHLKEDINILKRSIEYLERN